MEILEAKRLKNYLLGAKFIGKGRCAFCFLMKDGRVLKIYYNSSDTRNLYEYYNGNLIEIFTFLNSFNDEIFYGPVDIFLGDKVFAYIMEYAEGVNGAKLDLSMTIDEVEGKFGIFSKDLVAASRKDFLLRDSRPKNIIIGKNIKLIDLDFCRKNSEHTIEKLIQFNFREFIPALTKAVFKVNGDRDVLFYDKNLQDLFIEVIYSDYLAFYELLAALKEYGETIGDLRKAKLVYSRKRERYNN